MDIFCFRLCCDRKGKGEGGGEGGEGGEGEDAAPLIKKEGEVDEEDEERELLSDEKEWPDGISQFG